jgi:hypothetical protein
MILMDENEKRHVQISWELLEHRYRYWVIDDTNISDQEYDALDREYLSLCNKLKKPNTVSSSGYEEKMNWVLPPPHAGNEPELQWDPSKRSRQFVAQKVDNMPNDYKLTDYAK